MYLKVGRILICIFELILSLIKLNYYLKVFPDFGKLVQLVYKVIQDILTFMLMFIIYVLLFTLMTYSFETVLDPEDGDDYPMYPGVTKFLSAFLQTWRNSVGDIALPSYPYWTALFKGDDYAQTIPAGSMILLIWIQWFVNQYINMIIMLNFLIAIISQSYEEVMSTSAFTRAQQRCSMNEEYQIAKKGL